MVWAPSWRVVCQSAIAATAGQTRPTWRRRPAGGFPAVEGPRFVTDFGRRKPAWRFAAAAGQRQGLYRAAKVRALEVEAAADRAEVAAALAGVAAALAGELGAALPQCRPAAFANAQGPGRSWPTTSRPGAAGPAAAAAVGLVAVGLRVRRSARG